MEEEISFKMKEFMTVIDQVKKYRTILGALPDLAIIIGLAIVGFIAGNVFYHLGRVFSSQPNVAIANTFSVLSIISGVAFGFFWVYRKMKRQKTGEWKKTLSEGAPGAIKLLQSINWEDTFRDIRYAKMGFWFYGILKTIALWLLTFGISLIAAGFLSPIIHWEINYTFVVGLFSLALVLAINSNDYKRRFEQIGRLDALLWELRWFDNEFRRNPFQT
jgi:hypothetical protein